MDGSKVVRVDAVDTERPELADPSRAFEIPLNGQTHRMEDPVVTREEIVILAKLDSDNEVCVRVFTQGAKPRVLLPGETVDLSVPGIENILIDEKCVTKVEVNGTPIQIAVPNNGKGIKETAITAGVNIELDFVLYLELEDGQAEQIDDDEVVFPCEDASFIAVTGDDNS